MHFSCLAQYCLESPPFLRLLQILEFSFFPARQLLQRWLSARLKILFLANLRLLALTERPLMQMAILEKLFKVFQLIFLAL